MRRLKQVATGLTAALALAAFSGSVQAGHVGGGGFGHMGGHLGGFGQMRSFGHMGGFSHSHFARFDHGFHRRHHGFVAFSPFFYDDYYNDDYDSGYCYWRHGRRFCRY